MSRRQPTRAWSLLRIALGHVALAVWLSVWAGCTSQPVLRSFEAVPAGAEELDEGTNLVTRRHLSNFKLCVQRSRLVDGTGLEGHPLDLVFSLTPSGQAAQVKLLSARFEGTAFASCVMRILTWIRFSSTRSESRQVRLRLYLDEKNPLGQKR